MEFRFKPQQIGYGIGITIIAVLLANFGNGKGTHCDFLN
jgi:hypothetical protein